MPGSEMRRRMRPFKNGASHETGNREECQLQQTPAACPAGQDGGGLRRARPVRSADARVPISVDSSFFENLPLLNTVRATQGITPGPASRSCSSVTTVPNHTGF